MQNPPVEGQQGGVGARLTRARQAAGLTEAQAAQRLHLDLAVVQALEAERFEAMGAAVFARGHLRRYAALLGLSEAEIEAAYAASSRQLAHMPDLKRLATHLANPNAPPTALRPRTAAIGAVVLVIAALVWWAMRMPPRPPAAPAPKPVPATPADPATGDVPAGVTPAGSTSDAAAPGFATPGVATRGVDQPAAIAAASAAASRAAHGSETAVVPSDKVSAAAADPTVQLVLKFSQDSWIEAHDALGRQLLSELASAGSQRRLSGTAPLHLLLGNPAGVAFELNGKPVTLQQAAQSSEALQISLDGGGRMVDVQARRAAAQSAVLHP